MEMEGKEGREGEWRLDDDDDTIDDLGMGVVYRK